MEVFDAVEARITNCCGFDVVALVQAPAVLAESWSGICFFNQDTMPCQIGSDPYELHVRRVDGSSARFRFNASTDSFAGPENGIWTVSHDPIRGLIFNTKMAMPLASCRGDGIIFIITVAVIQSPSSYL